MKKKRSIRRRTRTDKGDKFSEGTRLLWLALQKRGWSIGSAKAAMGLHEGVLNRILYGDRGAGLKLAMLLEKELGVPLAAWAKPPKKEFELPQFLGAA